MENMIALLISGVFSIYFFFRTIKLYIEYKRHPISVKATVLEISDLSSSDENTFKLNLFYTYNNFDFNTSTNSYLFKRPAINSTIIVKINPFNPSSVKYYGKGDKLYYWGLIITFAADIILIAYTIYYASIIFAR